eukprot:jgi/Mesvir1/12909/Mv26283-RA.1
MRASLDPHLGESQMGFRVGRNCVMVTITARRLIEEVGRLPPGLLPLLLIFVDYTKAFDTVIWDALWVVLHLFRVPSYVVEIIRQFYEGSQAQVRTTDGVTPAFPLLHTGLWQGSVCALPISFHNYGGLCYAACTSPLRPGGGAPAGDRGHGVRQLQRG